MLKLPKAISIVILSLGVGFIVAGPNYATQLPPVQHRLPWQPVAEKVIKKPVAPKPTPVAQPPTPVSAPQPTPQPQAPVKPTTQSNPVEDAINQVRARHGLAPLTTNLLLRQSALARANTLCANNVFSHDGWLAAIQTTGYQYANVGENIASGYNDVASLVQAWVNSPEHLANILGDYTEQAAVVITCNHYMTNTVPTSIAVNHFGRPQ